MLIGGQYNGQKAKARQLEPYLLAAQIPELTELQQLHFGRELPKTLEKLLLIGGQTAAESYISGLGGEDYRNIPALGIQITTADGQITRAAIRTVYGATETMPFRGLSYLLPGLIYMENMQSGGIRPPQFQVVFANNISSRLDSLNAEKTMEQAQKFAEIARNYVQTFFPALFGSVIFLKDTSLEKGSLLRSELLSVAAVLRNKAGKELQDALKMKGANNGAARMSIFYGAAHPLFHDADIPGSLEPLLADQPNILHPDTIISIGGYQEQDFYKLRHSLKPYLSATYNIIKTLQFFTKNRVPPYYMARGGDISLDDVINGKRSSEISSAAQHDLDYLKKVSDARGDIKDFIEKQKEKRAA